MKVDIGVDTSPLVEIGIAGLNPQIGIDEAGQLAGNTARIGVQLYSEAVN